MAKVLSCTSCGVPSHGDLVRGNRGFSLVELLVVIAIIGILTALLLPAVQAARESARRTSCMNNLHNHAVALANYHAQNMRLPPGRYSGRIAPQEPVLGFSWAAYILPFVEQRPLFEAIDFRVAWDAPANETTVRTYLPLFQCPSSEEIFVGESDYGGINGTAMMFSPAAEELGFGDLDKVLNRGVLIPCRSIDDGVNFKQVTDGLSNTLAVGESPVRSDLQESYWASGTICMSHDSGSVNSTENGIFSDHPGGAHAARADESVSFMSEDVADYVVGALCTRDAGD